MMVGAVAQLTPEEYSAVKRALRRPIGRYGIDRASQLSGVPRSTLYDWAGKGHLVPDFAGWSPKQWSYRDLVLARLFAWTRSKKIPVDLSASEVRNIRVRLEARSLDPSTPLRATPIGLHVGDEPTDDVSGASAMPSIIDVLLTFNLVEPVDDITGMWGPSLVRPSPCTTISPDVFAGEPTIRRTRITTAALYALSTDRGLDADDIASIYSGLTAEQVHDGLELERQIRRVTIAA
jgi:uncharacterized protein (DUF433 family)